MMRAVLVMLLSLVLMCSCTDAAQESDDGLVIVASSFPCYDAARAVLGGTKGLTMLLPPGTDTHSFEPTIDDVVGIQECDLLIYVGGESDGWLDSLLSSLDEDVTTFALVDNVPLLLEEETDGILEEEGHEDHDHGHGVVDEHVWTSLGNEIAIIDSLCSIISSLDRDGEEEYRLNADRYIASLEEIRAEIQMVVQDARRHEIVVADRFPLLYFATEAGLGWVAAYPGCARQSEPSLRTVAALVDRIEEDGIPVVLHMEMANTMLSQVVARTDVALTTVDPTTGERIIRSMAEGLKEGCGGTQLVTFHPRGGAGSADWFHNEPWLDFNMRQNGHNQNYPGACSKTLDDYQRKPAKPVIDGEPLYEDHPLSFRPDRYGHSIAADVRRPFYWDVFNGACGHTYGHHSIWQMYEPEEKRKAPNHPLMSWKKALKQPGAQQMAYGRMLMESRPAKGRIPDESIIVPHPVPTAVPGSGHYRFAATRDEAGTYLMVYAPVGRTFTIRTDFIKSKKLKAWWYNPRNGRAELIGRFANQGKKEFTPPTPGETTDWVLVVDDANRKYPAPGKPLKE